MLFGPISLMTMNRVNASFQPLPLSPLSNPPLDMADTTKIHHTFMVKR